MKNLAELRGVAPYYYDWLSHPPEDPWWDWAELRNKYANVHAAVLNLSGWYDDNYGPEGATTNFNGLRAARKPGDARIHCCWDRGFTAARKKAKPAIALSRLLPLSITTRLYCAGWITTCGTWITE